MSQPKDSDPDAAVWDARYRELPATLPVAARVLIDYVHLLPARGLALDLACGLGGNALLLAAHGLTTHAWDYSAQAIAHLRALSEAQGIEVQALQRDVVAEPPAVAGFDVIVVSHFLERGLFPALCAALRPGGLLFYQTFTRSRVSDAGPRNPDYRLADNELLALTRPLQVLLYREEARVGDIGAGWRDQAMLVARRADDGSA